MPSGHTANINKIIELDNSDLLISCSDDFTCKIWSKRTGKLVANLKGHTDRITSIEFSKRYNKIITGSEDSLICFNKLTKSGISTTKLRVSNKVSSFTLDTVSQILYILEGNNKISSWDLKKNEIIKEFTYDRCDFSSLKFNYDTKSLIILSWNGPVYINESPIKRELIISSSHNNYVNKIFFGEKKLLYTSSWDGTIVKLKQSDSIILKKYKLSNNIIFDFKLVNNDSIVLVATSDNKLLIYNLVNNILVKTICFNDMVLGVTINESKTKAAIISKDGCIKLVDIKTFRVIKSRKFKKNLESCQYINKSKDLLCTFSKGSAIVLESDSLISKFNLGENMAIPNNTIVDSDGSIFLSNINDNSYSVWDMKNGVFLNKKTIRDCIIDLDYPNKNGDILMNNGVTLKLYNKKANYYSKQRTFHKEIIKTGFSKTGKTPYVILSDNELLILDEITLNPIEKYLKPSYGYFINIEFMSNDSTFIVGDTDGFISIYNRNTKHREEIAVDEDVGEVIYIKEIQSDKICVVSTNNISIVDLVKKSIINSVKINPIISDAKIDNNQLYISHYNGIIEIWNLNKFELEKIQNSEIPSIKINTTEKHLLIASLDGQIYFKKKEDFKTEFIFHVLKDGNYIISLFNSPYYMCSKDASKMIHYVTPDLRLIGFDQLDPIYNRPDLVLSSIGKYFGGADEQLVSQYRLAWEKRIERLGLDKDKLGKGEFDVPEANIENTDSIVYENNDGDITLHLKANDINHKLIRYNIFVNEVPIYGSQGISLSHLNIKKWEATVSLPLSIGQNKIQFSVMNEIGLESFKYPTYVNYLPKSNDIVARTYYIGIGVDDFKQQYVNNRETKLNFCVKDITDLGNIFSDNSNTIVQLFINKKVTKENIISIKKFLLENTTVNDKVIISCSSHGLLDENNNFYLAMHDIDFNKPHEGGLAYEELENLLDGIPARKKLLLLDACNSGDNETLDKKNQETINTNNIDSLLVARGVILREDYQNNSFNKMNELFINTINKTGAVVISAARGRQDALEGNSVIINNIPIENGAFTYAVLEYLKGNKSFDEKLTVNQLKRYVEERVVEITQGKQQPTSRQETMDVDWILK